MCLGGIFRCTRGVRTAKIDALGGEFRCTRMSRSKLSMVQTLSGALIFAAAAVSSPELMSKAKCIDYFTKSNLIIDGTGAVWCIDSFHILFRGSIPT